MVNKFIEMTYQETLDYLIEKLPMFQRTGPAAYKNTLQNTLELDERYGHPHQNFKTIHVAGTNGKGSVSHMLTSIMQEAGYKTGLYTSPHLKDFRERIRINGQMISEEMVVNWVDQFVKNNSLWKISPSFFELTVAMAFDYFAQQNVDIAIIEVGLGGRLDSTNIITPEISVITNIGLDHTNLLGNTLKEIAAEKAGVIKKNIPVVIGQKQKETQKVFEDKASLGSSPLFFADDEIQIDYSMVGIDCKQIMNVNSENRILFPDLKLDLLGTYQRKNVPAVLKVIELLQKQQWAIKDEHIYEGLANCSRNTGLLGRWQILGNNPLVVCDTGHNEDGIRAIVEQIKNTAYKKLHMVFGTVGDKDPEAILKLLPQDAIYYFTKSSIPRAMDEKVLAEKAKKAGLQGKSYPTVKSAFDTAIANASSNDLVFVGGSTFIVAEIL